MRESGVLMHVTSLPGPYGVGTLGKHAYAFVDFLEKAGQRYWQLLPLTPTGYGDSPYQSCSAFAGNPYLIDLDALVEGGLLTPDEVEQVCWQQRENRVDYGILYHNRLNILRLAYDRFGNDGALDAFALENSSWLPDYCLFMALKRERDGMSWQLWEEPLKCRQPEAMEHARQRCREEIRFYTFVQYLFFTQWDALRSYARKKGISMIGDIPFYMSLDSVEVWTAPKLFQLDRDLLPKAVAGCPPDAFSPDGQLWGNPLYRWDVMEEDGYRWWICRLQGAQRLYDVVRLDHFRGFASYWSVPYGETTAKNGKWNKGPGLTFIRRIKAALPELGVIAEDLGFLTREVTELREASGFPGMKVLQFAFDSREQSDYLPHNYTPNTVCYTGTHDNMTARQWWESAADETVAYGADYMGLKEEEGPVWGMIRTAMRSVSDLCIIPMQDYLQLGEEARMNHPGVAQGNWTWRAEERSVTSQLAEKIRKLTELYGRSSPSRNF